jgi:hypothetical protein
MPGVLHGMLRSLIRRSDRRLLHPTQLRTGGQEGKRQEHHGHRHSHATVGIGIHMIHFG